MARVEENIVRVSLCFRLRVLLQLVILIVLLSKGRGKVYEPCPMKTTKEARELYVATCDTRSGWKEFQALKTWNLTGYVLNKKGLAMKNVCTGRNWGQLGGFLTKPLLYLEHIKSLPKKSPQNGAVYVILMDSDTFWASSDVAAIWNKFDCARGDKEMILSTEMSCWIGRYCTQEDLHRYYNHTPSTPSYSPFVNSGIVMGRTDVVQRMLEYVIENNKKYYITYYRNKFDDQYAYADYALKVRPEEVAFDYHQQLLASFSMHAPNDPHDEGWPFVCKGGNWTHELCPSCPNLTPKLQRQGHFYVDLADCHVKRKMWKDMPMEKEARTLAPDPVIWHGNGAGKRTYYDFGYKTSLCHLDRRKFKTMKEYEEVSCCDR